MDKVKSPLVPASKVSLLETVPADKLIKAWKTYYDIEVTEEFHGIENIFLYRCETSQLDFFTPSSVAGSDQLYHNLRRLDWFYMPEKWEFDEAIKDIAGCRSILEVGCGPGFFIEKAMKNFNGRTIKGIDMSKSSIENAISRNLPVEKAGVKEILDRGDRFETVCSFQVLEHIDQPYDFLDALVKLIKRGGRLILCVPNKESFLKHQDNILDMPPHHMTKWNVFTFKYLEKLFPLRLTRISFEPLAKYHIHGYVDAYNHYWRESLLFLKQFTTMSRLNWIKNFLEKSGLYRLLRGQSLYVVFEKL